MNLTEFLLARLEEDEASVITGSCVCDPEPQRPDCPDRVLADCDAKRQIVKAFEMVGDVDTNKLSAEGMWCRFLVIRTAHHLAALYADHPDFREEWKL